jgi:hypothetical protein
MKITREESIFVTGSCGLYTIASLTENLFFTAEASFHLIINIDAENER